MIGDYISDEVIEHDTRSLIEVCRKEFDWPVDYLPIPIDEIIEFHFGLEVEWQDLSRITHNDNVLAAICSADKKIYMNTSYEKTFTQNPGLLNFTLGHELGHWQYHAKQDNLCITLNFGIKEEKTYLCRMNRKDRIELQADHFSAFLLMPASLIVKYFLDIPEPNRYTWPALYSLKDTFAVSISALINRLTNLNLLYVKDKNIYRNASEAYGEISLF